MLRRAVAAGLALTLGVALCGWLALLVGATRHGALLLFVADGRLQVVDVERGLLHLLDNQTQVRDFMLSPDGANVVYSDGIFILAAIGVDGEGRRYLSDMSTGDAQTLSWSGDGATIAWVTNQLHIYTADSEGGVPTQVTAGDETVYAPAWSPDGRWLAFLSLRGGFPEIYLRDVASGEVRKLTRNRYVDSFLWSPDGVYIAFNIRTDTDTEILSVRVEDGAEFNLSRSGADENTFRWSPDSRRVVFSSIYGPRRSQLFVVNADGSRRQQLSDGSSNDLLPLWSPDGSTIAFLCGAELSQLHFCLWGDDGVRRSLSDNRYSNMSAAWSPDSRQLAFLSTRDGELALYVMDVGDAQSTRRLTFGMVLANIPPVWIP